MTSLPAAAAAQLAAQLPFNASQSWRGVTLLAAGD